MGSVSTPPDRNYGQETRDTLKAQVDLAPDQYAANAQFQPLYAGLQTDVAKRSLLGANGNDGLLSLYQNAVQPQLSQISSGANTAQRTADINDVANLGPGAVAAIKAANPEQQALLKQANAGVAGQANEDPLVTMLRQQAADELGRGASLDPSLARQVQQTTRAGQAARGFGYGMPDLQQEALFTGQAAEQLRQNRRNFASGVVGLTGQDRTQRLGNLGQVAQMNAAGNVDPMMAILGRSSTAYNPGMIQQGYGAAQQSGANLFNPESAYAGDIYNTNYNGAAAAKIASANNQSALIGAGISAAGSIGKSA